MHGKSCSTEKSKSKENNQAFLTKKFQKRRQKIYEKDRSLIEKVTKEG